MYATYIYIYIYIYVYHIYTCIHIIYYILGVYDPSFCHPFCVSERSFCILYVVCIHIHKYITYIMYCTSARHFAWVSAAQQCAPERPFGILHWVRIDITHVYMYDTPYMYSIWNV